MLEKFDLPTIEDADARTAYDFYRLTHRSKKVHLIYNSNPDGWIPVKRVDIFIN